MGKREGEESGEDMEIVGDIVRCQDFGGHKIQVSDDDKVREKKEAAPDI